MLEVTPRELQQIHLEPSGPVDFGRVCEVRREDRIALERSRLAFATVWRPLQSLWLFGVCDSRFLDVWPCFSALTVLPFLPLHQDSVNLKVIKITNNLQRDISLSLSVSRVELKRSKVTKTLAPGETGEAVIDLSSISEETPRQLRVPLTILVNGLYDIKLQILAQVVPFKLTMSTHKLLLSSGSSLHGRRPGSVVVLSNPFGRPAPFVWVPERPNSGFVMHPSQGQVPPHSDLSVVIVLKPEDQDLKPCRFILTDLGADADEGQELICRASYKGSACRFSESRTNFGVLTQHAVNRREAILYNGGTADAYYSISDIKIPFSVGAGREARAGRGMSFLAM
jgi:hypothetical protein